MDNKNNTGFGESTVFSKPPQHNDRPTGEKRKKIIKLVSVVLGLALLAGAVYSVVVLIPEKQTEPEAIQVEQVCSYKNTDVDVIEYSVDGEDMVLHRIETPGYNDPGISWLIDGIEEEKQEKNLTNKLAELTLNFQGIRMEDASDSAYGFENPVSVIHVKGGSVDYTVYMGKEIEDGRYAKLTGDVEGVFRTDSTTAGRLTMKKLGFASRTAYTAAKFSTDVSAYQNAGGMLERFDSLTLKSKASGREMVFVMNDDELSAAYSKHLMASENNFYTQNTDKLLSLFTDTLFVAGAYSYDDDEQSLAKLGLDDPDYVVTLNVGGERKWFKFKAVNDNDYAVVSDDRHIITKVTAENIPFLNMKESDFLYGRLLPFGLTDIVSFKASGADGTAEMTVNTSQSGEVTVVYNGNKAEGFADFFDQVTSLSPVFGDFEGAAEPCDVFTFTLKNSAAQEIAFYNTGNAKYLLKTNGITAQISATAYSRMIRKLQSIIK